MSRFICFISAVLCIVALTISPSSAAPRCPIDSIKVNQAATGRVVNSKSEWKVTIKSECMCSVSHLTLFCPKFHNGIAINPPVISIDNDGHCLVNTMNPIFKGGVVEFTYAWNPIDFQPFNFYEACS